MLGLNCINVEAFNKTKQIQGYIQITRMTHEYNCLLASCHAYIRTNENGLD